MIITILAGELETTRGAPSIFQKGGGGSKKNLILYSGADRKNFVHAHFSNKLPSPLSNYFTLTSQVSHKSTRLTQTKKKLLYIPRYSTNRLQRCIKYQGVKIWNDIPLAFKIPRQNYLKPNSRNISFKTTTSLPFKIYDRIIRC